MFCHKCILTLVLLDPDIPCLCKQCRSRSVGFWRSQLIRICTVSLQVCKFVSTTWIKYSDWLKIRSGCGILIYSAWKGLTFIDFRQHTIDTLKYQLSQGNAESLTEQITSGVNLFNQPNGRQPSLAECEAVIRRLQHINEQQQHEVSYHTILTLIIA